MLTQKQSAFWWTANIRTLLYFARELTGPLIIIALLFHLPLLGLAAALLHTFTWLWVSVKIAPIPLSKTTQIGGFIGLLGIWIGTSYLLFTLFYESNSVVPV